MSEQFAGSTTVNNRTWEVYATLEEDGSVSHIRMTWGCAERSFAPGTEHDAVTKAGACVVRTAQRDEVEFTHPDEDPLIEDY